MGKHIRHTENFPLFIKDMQLRHKRQNIMVRLHDEHSVERAISNAVANEMSIALDIAHAYLYDENWVHKRREKLARKLGCRNNLNSKGGKNAIQTREK